MKNPSIAVLAVLGIVFCCFGQLVLIGIGGAGILTGILANSKVLFSTGLVMLVIVGVYFGIKKSRRSDQKNQQAVEELEK